MENELTPEERVDAALDRVLKASGSALRHYSCASTLKAMRDVMRSIMADEDIAGVHSEMDASAAAKGRRK